MACLQEQILRSMHPEVPTITFYPDEVTLHRQASIAGVDFGTHEKKKASSFVFIRDPDLYTSLQFGSPVAGDFKSGFLFKSSIFAKYANSLVPGIIHHFVQVPLAVNQKFGLARFALVHYLHPFSNLDANSAKLPNLREYYGSSTRIFSASIIDRALRSNGFRNFQEMDPIALVPLDKLFCRCAVSPIDTPNGNLLGYAYTPVLSGY